MDISASIGAVLIAELEARGYRVCLEDRYMSWSVFGPGDGPDNESSFVLSSDGVRVWSVWCEEAGIGGSVFVEFCDSEFIGLFLKWCVGVGLMG